MSSGDPRFTLKVLRAGFFVCLFWSVGWSGVFSLFVLLLGVLGLRFSNADQSAVKVTR